jgi:hypothetical protein
MLFNVPLPYKVKGTPKGKRNETDEQYWEYVEIDIPVMTDESAPIAVEWIDAIPEDCTYLRFKDDWLRDQWVPENGVQVMRMKEGEFYLRRPDGMTPDILASKLNPHADFRMFGNHFIYHNSRDAEKPVDQATYRQDKDFSSTLADEVTKLRRAAECFFIVGDEIYELSSEPVIIKATYQTDNNGAKIMPRVIPNHRLSKSAVTYRLDKYAQVVDEINELHEKFSRWDKGMVTMERAPKVYRSEAASFNDLEVNFVNAIRNHVENIGDYIRLKSVDPDEGIATLQLRKALADFDTAGDISVLEEAAGNLVENFPKLVRSYNVIPAYREFANRPVDTLTAGSWRKGR